MSDLIRKDASELAGLVSSGEVSAVEVAQAHLDRIAAVDGEVHAFLHVDAKGALVEQLSSTSANISFGNNLQEGLYFVQIQSTTISAYSSVLKVK